MHRAARQTAGTINLGKHSSVMSRGAAGAAPPAERVLKAGAAGCGAGSGSCPCPQGRIRELPLSLGLVAWK